MNLKRIQKVRDFIAKLPATACHMKVWCDAAIDEAKEEIDDKVHYIPLTTMRRRGWSCGTAACIGGWTELMTAKKLDRYGDPENVNAARYLELDSQEAAWLFYEFPESDPRSGWKKWMVKRLDGIIRDKEIKPWTIQMAPKKSKRRGR